jgi:hypothetical protein
MVIGKKYYYSTFKAMAVKENHLILSEVNLVEMSVNELALVGQEFL